MEFESGNKSSQVGELFGGVEPRIEQRFGKLVELFFRDFDDCFLLVREYLFRSLKILFFAFMLFDHVFAGFDLPFFEKILIMFIFCKQFKVIFLEIFLIQNSG